MEHAAADLVTSGAIFLLGFVVVPLWMLMGLADYFCHRATDIEHTAGARESVLHLVQFGSVGIPLAGALFLEVNAALLVTMAVFILFHHFVTYIDVRYADAARGVPPIEQMVHSFLELLPITAFLLLCALEFDQLKAIFGAGRARADFLFRLRMPPLPWWYIASVLATAAVINFAPYVEEFIRCVRATRLVNRQSLSAG